MSENSEESTEESTEEATNTAALFALPPMERIKVLRSDEHCAWRLDMQTKNLLLVRLQDNAVLGMRQQNGEYFATTNLTEFTSYCADEVLDGLMASFARGKSLAAVARDHGVSLGQLRYWVQRNVVFKERYDEALWASGHHSWERAEVLAEDLASGDNTKTEADAKGRAMDYYAGTRDKLLKDEFAIKSKQEVATVGTTTIIFQSQAEYSEADKLRLAKEVGDLGDN